MITITETLYMTHFDLFSGYGGFTLALKNSYETNITLQRNRSSRPECRGSDTSLFCGESMSTAKNSFPITIGFSEIDKYASAVLKYHWPNIKNYGDISKINWAEVPDFDLLTGGSPCQDLSIAGKRSGLDGKRSALFYEYIRAIKEKQPKYFIWENVKGALSSRSGWDFASVINEMAEAGYSLWWQVLNSKDFGVPQNRERIFVVGFRDEPAREIFFERCDDQAHIGEEPSQGRRILKSPIRSQGDKPMIHQINNPTHSNNRLYGDNGISPALNTAQVGNRQPNIIAPNGKEIDISNRPNRPFQLTEVRTEKGKQTRKEIRQKEGRDSTLRGRDDKKYIPLKQDLANCLTTGKENIEKWIFESRIRRLTPVECERLMGLPDDWTSKGIIDGKEVEISDSQRYKLAGNGVVVNVVEEILKEIIL